MIRNDLKVCMINRPEKSPSIADHKPVAHPSACKYLGVRSGFKKTMRRARKKGQSGLRAHPTIIPGDSRRSTRKPLSRSEWHIQYIMRCIKRGESVKECNL